MLWIAELEGEIAIVDDELTDRDKSHVDAYASHHGTLAEVITTENFKILNQSLGWADKEEISHTLGGCRRIPAGWLSRPDRAEACVPFPPASR